ncbi:MAG: chromosome segregation protein SMC [Armatimonadota bacterium]
MFVKRLELLGFKTFADKTVIEFSEGITAIVGPNGSGKSNIVDALIWVLGESNVRNIRGHRVTDVIFNGSEGRRAIGMAEVSLTLDNSSRILPLDFTEVTITRRAYRSGEGEFFINQTRCRLKDIYELFLDTGLGRGAYSIIGQGEIDSVLSVRPEDRRELFEEAAGVKKYRYRREEALRKLEKTEANLRRVCDIMAEIGGQLEPLAEQAEQARRYSELQARLWDIEVGLLIRDLKRFVLSLEEVRFLKKNAEALVEKYDRELAELEVLRSDLSSDLNKTEKDLEEARHALQAVSENLQRVLNKRAVAEERLKAANNDMERMDGELTGLTDRLRHLRERIEELTKALHAGRERERQLSAEVETQAAFVTELEAKVREAMREADAQKSSYFEFARELAEKRSALQNLRGRVSEFKNELERKNEQLQDLESEIEKTVQNRNEALAKLRDLTKRVDKTRRDIANLQTARGEYEECTASIKKDCEKVSQELTAITSRLSTLREMAEDYEGFYEGVRNVIKASRKGLLVGDYSIVAEVITVPEGLEVAIEMALGASAQDVITPSVDEAKRAIEFLKRERAGRATFLPLASLRVTGSDIRGISEGRDGLLGVAANLVKSHAKYMPAIQVLLGKTLVVDNIDHALYISRCASGWSKIVTLEGELIMPSGAITGGVTKGRPSGLLARKQMIEKLRKTAEELGNRINVLRTELSESENRVGEIDSLIRANGDKLTSDLSALSQLEKLVGILNHEFAVAEQKANSLRTEIADLEKLLEAETSRMLQLESELSGSDEDSADSGENVIHVQQNVESLLAKLDEERKLLVKLRVELASLVERNRALEVSVKDLSAEAGQTEQAIAARRCEKEIAVAETRRLIDEMQVIDREISEQRELLASAERRLNDLTESRAEIIRRADELDEHIRCLTRERGNKANEAHEADVKQARLEVQINQVKEKLFQEYDLSYKQALDWPEDELEIERGAYAEVARLRRELKEMEPVNTGAIQEYDRIKQRWDFLSGQRTDLENARAQIIQAIREIDANTRGIFMNTFAEVSTNFEAMFRRLFGGGTTKLSLTNPGDILETGVEIAVQPPGKKMQDLSLLSGGEKALTASALIFALLMARPSPLIVLDEVDAPLDEGNVERFAEVVRDFAKHSQFVVVTHNRATMEAADSLYGITMQEPGISKLVSVKLVSEEASSSVESSGVASSGTTGDIIMQ